MGKVHRLFRFRNTSRASLHCFIFIHGELYQHISPALGYSRQSEEQAKVSYVKWADSLVCRVGSGFNKNFKMFNEAIHIIVFVTSGPPLNIEASDSYTPEMKTVCHIMQECNQIS